MHIRNKILLLCCIIFYISATAQTFELGKVSKAELEEKSHPLEPGAEAAILYESGTTYLEYSDKDGFTMVTEAEIRIKIYSKSGYDWANKSISYYVGQNPSETVDFSKAVTYNLVNGAIEKTKLKSEGEFQESINKYYSQKKIAMPNVREGSVVEYKYAIRSPYLSTFPTWNFQNKIPVNYSEYVTRIPEYYTYQTNLKGYITPKLEKSSATRSYTFTTKERSGNYVTSTTFDTERINYNDNITTYKAEKMPSIKDENYVNNVMNYTSSIDHELSMVKFPNKPIKSYSATWDDVVKLIYESDSFGAELKKNNYFEADLSPILNEQQTKPEKIALIFNYVKSRMNWNSFRGYNCNDGVNKAYKAKVGNTAEINLMLTAMLRYAGIDANPVLLSTRGNGIAIFPNRTAFDYVIAAVEVENGLIFLDATDKNSLPDILPIRTLNWWGRIVRPNGSSAEVDLMPKSNSKDVVNMIATLDGDGKLNGNIREQYFDYNAFLYRVNYRNVAQESYLEKLEQRYNGLEINEYKSASDDFSKPVVETYTFNHNASAEIIGDKMYFSPLFFFREEENPFIQETREYPVDFIFPNQDKYAFTVNIPEGYVVESLPQSLSLKMGENVGNYKFMISSTGKQIQLISTLDINEAIVAPAEYETLKSFYKQMIEKQNEKIVLKKV
jgi:hypothetical protein